MLLTIDGLDGSGKTTAIATLVELCNANGIKATSVAEPGTTPLGLHVREFHLAHSETISPMSQLHLMLAARTENAIRIKALLEEYDVVFVDRWLHSTVTYQYLQHLDYWKTRKDIGDVFSWIHGEHNNVVDGLTPDKMIYLSIPQGIRRERLEARGKVYDLDKATFSDELDRASLDIAILLGMKICRDNVRLITDVMDDIKEVFNK